MKLRFLLGFAASLAFVSAGCGGPEVVRGANDPSIDAHALSTGLDKDDIQRALKETLNHLRAAAVMNEWRTTNPKPNVAILPFKNSTDEHIDSSLDAMLGEAEEWLVESQVVNVVSHERQREMIGEVRAQQSGDFDPATISKLGHQLGVKYFVTGKVSGNDERTEDMRRVQYYLQLQVIEADTSLIKFQKKAYVTKAIK
ncbi:MAG TPA: penicillin-binding protein activator LpoB [Labilithrix sp.]|jgi:hypothetical protein